MFRFVLNFVFTKIRSALTLNNLIKIILVGYLCFFIYYGFGHFTVFCMNNGKPKKLTEQHIEILRYIFEMSDHPKNLTFEGLRDYQLLY